MLIVDIGNNHFGSIESAKDHIKAAQEAGADMAKLQAFVPGDFEGSMPDAFYDKCALSFDEYKYLIEYGESIGMPVFYSIFNMGLLELDNYTEYSKLAAWQVNEAGDDLLKELDDAFIIMSINAKCENLPNLQEAIILYATEYNCDDPTLERLALLQRFYKRPIGLSDHSEGIDTCVSAIQLYEVPVIEKHFTIEKNMKFNGEVFRDTVHAADFTEMQVLAKYFKKQKETYKGVNSALFSMQ